MAEWIEKRNLGEVGKVRVSISEGHGTEWLNIRKFFEDETGQMRPTKQGVVIPRDRWGEFLDMLGGLLDGKREDD